MYACVCVCLGSGSEELMFVCVCLGSGSEELMFVRFVKSRTCYDVMPYSSKLVVFDTQLKVSRYSAMSLSRIDVSCKDVELHA